MALEKQPFFSAPSIPKLGKNTVSSSIFSSVSKSKPQLKTTPFSFFKPIQPQKEQGQDVTKTLTKIVSGENSKDKQVYSTLVETNRILVEIQKQLSLDFASRITEKKQSLSSLRASILKKRSVQKEKAIESVNNDSGLIRGAFDKITAPAKSIFDRIIQFLTTIATGFLVNAAFSWLSDEKNRQKLLEVFKFLTNHWKWLVGIFIGAKLVGAIIKIVNLVRRLKGLVELIRRVWGKPPKPPSTGGGGKGGGGGGGGLPGGGCGPVLDCLKNMSAADVENLAKRIIATKTFSPLLGAPSPIFSPTTKPTTAPPVLPVFPTPGLTPSTPTNPLTLPTPTQPPSLPQPTPRTTQPQGKPWWQTALDVGGILVDIASIAGIVLTLLPLIPGADDAVGVGLAGRLAAKYGSKARPTAAPGARNPIPKTNVTVNDPFSKAVESLRKRNYSYSDLRTILNDPKTSALDKKAAEKILTEAGQRTFSGGGTVGGTGPGNVDSVPAMLAPGEEVVRTSEAMRWRPLLKDINDNGATMWTDFTDAIKKQEENNTYQRQINFQFSNQLNDLNSELENLINQEKNKKIRDAGVKITPPVIGNIPPQEGTRRGGPSDVNPPVPQVPGRPTKAPEPFTGSVPSDQRTVSQPSTPTPIPRPQPTPTQTEQQPIQQPIQPISEPTPSIPSQPSGPTPIKVKVEPFRPETSFITPIKQPQKTYALKPESKPNVSIAPFSLPPIVSQSSGGEMAQGSVSDASSPPDVYSTNRSNNYITYAANAYGLV